MRSAGGLERPAATRALLAELVVRVGQRALVDRQTAAADAVGQTVAQVLQLLDALGEVGAPALRDPRPVLLGQDVVLGEERQHVPDPRQRDADPLRGAYEGHPAERVAGVAALVAGGAAAVDEPFALVEPQRGGGDSAALGQLADRQLM